MEFEKNNIYYYVPRLPEEKDTQLIKRVELLINQESKNFDNKYLNYLKISELWHNYKYFNNKWNDSIQEKIYNFENTNT